MLTSFNPDKKFILIVLFSLISWAGMAQKEFHAGVYHGGLVGQIGIGTSLDKTYFGELRFTASDVLEYPFGLEGYINRNLKQDEWYNIHVGFMLGYYFNGDGRIGLPLGLTVKPIESHRNLAILLEATPNMFTGSVIGGLRANLGLRYTFSRD